MSDPTDRHPAPAEWCRSLVSQFTAFGADQKEVKQCLLTAADEIDKLRVQCKMLMDDKAALMADLDAERLFSKQAMQTAQEVAAERDALRADNTDLQNKVVMPLREQLTLAESVRAAQVAGLVQGAENLQKAVEYYRAGIEHRAPKWVPSKVWLAGPVRGDYPIGHATIAHEGEYDCESNRYGAISVIAENGQRLGVKPAEFDVLEWRSNEPARAALKGDA
jgi:hypothetical protein